MTAPRLTVYLASSRPLAVVLRRGPSRWARLSLWHTDTDTVEHGQWMHARVYEHRSDVSGDGSLFVAFVKPHGPLPDGAEADTWISVSRPPWFTAVATWFVGSTWCAGGFFPAADRLWIMTQDPPDRGRLPTWLRLEKDLPHLEQTPEWTERLVQVNRLLRDGWVRTAPGSDGGVRHDALWTKPLADGRRLVRSDPWHGVAQEFAIDTEGLLSVVENATWLDVDHGGRAVFVREGSLWALTAGGEEHIADFSPGDPDPQPAPAPAREWPDPPGA